ncbi:Class I cytochrome c [Thauera humireducens]|uniref:c-type cytochrome n=1 Tax=Thauera humireducens TaxID=1134435 RepID=UPI002467A55B|nr:c-type cytochrome [Thauera humireducens]CAH1748330.1 Class I cytochrome c [Thauera humireducens]
MRAPVRALGAVVAASALLSTFPAQAEAGDRQVRVWAATCAACHGTDGHALAGMTSLAGRDADDLYALLSDFKSGVRPATVMHQHAKGYSDDELKRLAQWFAAQPKR